MGSWHKIARRIRVPLGFLFAAAYIWMAHPTVRSILIGSCVIALGVTIRALASGHVQKNEQLATSGPYAFTRNPLYLGSFVLACGFIVAARSWWVAIIAAAIFFAIYVPVMRSEEEFLRSQFPEFENYSRHVPRFFPRFKRYQSSSASFSAHLYWKHREYNAALGSALMLAVLAIKVAWFG